MIITHFITSYKPCPGWTSLVLSGFVLFFCTAWQEKMNSNELDSLLEVVDHLIENYELEQSATVLKQALEKAQNQKDSVKIRRIYGDLGYVNHLSGNYEKSISHYKLAYQYAYALFDTARMVSFSRSIGLNFQRIGLHNVSLEYFLQSLDLAKNSADKELLANLYNSLGVLYHQNNEPDISLDYLRQSLEFYTLIEDQSGKAKVYNNMAISFQQKEELDSCIRYNLLALSLKKEIGNPRETSSTLNNLGEIYLELSQEDTAYSFLEEAYTIHRQLNEPESMAISFNNFADYWQRKGDFQKSEKYLDSARQIIQTIQAKELQIDNLSLWVSQYEKTRQFDRALRVNKIWDSLKAELFLEEKVKIKDIANLYVLREKEFEKEQIAQQASLFEIKSAQFQTTSILLGVLGIVLTVFSLLTFRNLKIQKNQSEQIRNQNRLIKAQQVEIRHRTSNSLARIQSTINTIRRKAPDPVTKADLVQAGRILQTAASLERYLYDVEDEMKVPLAEYLDGLLDHHREIFILESNPTLLSLSCPPTLFLPVNQILNISIILDEWLRNSTKYAFKHTQNPQITIGIEVQKQLLSITYKDNGSGIEEKRTKGTGSELIEKFARDLDASILSKNENGTQHCLRFKLRSD